MLKRDPDARPIGTGSALDVMAEDADHWPVLPHLAGDGVLGVLDTRSGELVGLDQARPEQLAHAVAYLNEVGQRVLALRTLYDEAILDRMDRARAWTLREAGTLIEAPSDAPEEAWDVAKLRGELRRLVRANVITSEAAASCWLTPKPPEPKPAKKVLGGLLKHPDPAVREAIAGCRRELPKRSRPVKVTLKEVR